MKCDKMLDCYYRVGNKCKFGEFDSCEETIECANVDFEIDDNPFGIK